MQFGLWLMLPRVSETLLQRGPGQVTVSFFPDATRSQAKAKAKKEKEKEKENKSLYNMHVPGKSKWTKFHR